VKVLVSGNRGLFDILGYGLADDPFETVPLPVEERRRIAGRKGVEEP
jgi:hypothetical protein